MAAYPIRGTKRLVLCNKEGGGHVSFSMSMKARFFRFAILAVILAAVGNLAIGQGVPAGFNRWEVTVDGVVREAMVHAPTTAQGASAPVVFIFHGHGGNMRQVERSFAIEKEWPEAICVYMQGLPTVGALTDPEGKKAGWQARDGSDNDRDLKFFDAMLARLKKEYKVDEKRIYATGHSNGGAFTYLLWAERGDVFAAVAPSAAIFVNVGKLKPKPVMHLAGEKDPLVKYQWQKRMMETVRRLDGCEAEGKSWGENATLYASKTGTPVVTFIHSGGHEFKPSAPPLIVKFFKEHPGVAK